MKKAKGELDDGDREHLLASTQKEHLLPAAQGKPTHYLPLLGSVERGPKP
jgi:hypothetical protein